MAQVRRISDNLQALTATTGVVVPPDENGYVTLGVATYYFLIGGTADLSTFGAHILTDATIVGVFTVELSGLPRSKGDGGPVDVADYSATTGEWVKIDPPTAYVPTNGTGWSVAALTLTKTAGVGGALIDVGNFGERRARISAAITTGGKVRVSSHGKSG